RKIAILVCLSLAACKSSAPNPTPEAESPPAGGPGAEAQAPGQDGSLQHDAQSETLAQQRKRILIDAHLANGAQYLKDLRLDDAARGADAALELEPDNLNAKQLRGEALAMKGEPVGQMTSASQDAVQRYQLRVQQLKADAADSLRKAKLLIARSDYPGAINE